MHSLKALFYLLRQRVLCKLMISISQEINWCNVPVEGIIGTLNDMIEMSALWSTSYCLSVTTGHVQVWECIVEHAFCGVIVIP